jgi:hypothetical protein
MLELMSVILPHQDRVSDWRSFYERYTAAQVLHYLQLNVVYDFSIGQIYDRAL